jgi:hypothetical protein
MSPIETVLLMKSAMAKKKNLYMSHVIKVLAELKFRHLETCSMKLSGYHKALLKKILCFIRGTRLVEGLFIGICNRSKIFMVQGLFNAHLFNIHCALHYCDGTCVDPVCLASCL